MGSGDFVGMSTVIAIIVSVFSPGMLAVSV